MKKSVKFLSVLFAVLAITAAARADTGTIDLTPITDGLTTMKTAIIAMATILIGSIGVVLGAYKMGARWAVSLVKIFAKG